MAIKTNYDYKGIAINDAYIRINRIFGSKTEGWNSLVGVYHISSDENNGTIYNKIDEFNHSAAYNEDERGYTTLYKSLAEKFGGVKC